MMYVVVERRVSLLM